jgi:soluble lytic murein transglycosylase
MRVMEATQIYRARINGGVAPLTLTADLKRGGYAPSNPYSPTIAAYPGAAGSTTFAATPGATLPR